MTRPVNVDDRLCEVLPTQAAFVVGPIAAQVRGYVRQTVQAVIRSDDFQTFWVAANRTAHQQAVAILRGNSEVVQASGTRVDIDLLPLVNMVPRQLSDALPTLFGHEIRLPDLGSGQIPATLRSTVEKALGVTLPANFAQFTVYDRGRLLALQVALVQARRDLVLLVVGTVLLLGSAFLVSPRRRRARTGTVRRPPSPS